MSVWKDKAGRYHVAIQRGGNRIHRICPPAATWRDAKRKEAELEQRFQAVASGKVLIADAIQHWLKTEVAHHSGRKGTESNAYALADFVKGRTLQDVVSVANAYKQSLRGLVTNSTINRRLAVLRRVANLAYRRWGWLSEPLGSRVELLPENAARERFLTRDEVGRLLRAIPQRAIRRAVLVAAFTGLRRGELAKLRPINVQGDLIHLRTTKNGHPRVVPVVHHIAFALRRLPFGHHPDTLTHAVARAMPGARFHDLRRTTGSLLLQEQVSIETISDILGHSDIRVTKRIYAHFRVDDKRAAMAKLGKKSAQPLHQEKKETKQKVA
jgi:integrase